MDWEHFTDINSRQTEYFRHSAVRILQKLDTADCFRLQAVYKT